MTTAATAYRAAALSARQLARAYPDNADYHNDRAEGYERSAKTEADFVHRMRPSPKQEGPSLEVAVHDEPTTTRE